MAECNNYTGLQINPTPSSIGNQYAGVSTDEKPANAPTYSVYLELDTGKFYYYDGTEWKEVPCCGSGGGGGGDGGGDYKTANVTIIGDNNGEAWQFSIHASQDKGLYLCAFDINGNFSTNLYTIGAPITAKVVYTGESALVIPDNNFVSATGNAVYDSDTKRITITGDCTITGYWRNK